MKAIDLLEVYPLSAKVINQHFTNELMKSIKEDKVPEEFKEYARKRGVDNDQIAVFMDVNPRSVFEILDKNDIVIQILHSEETGFAWKIDVQEVNANYYERKDAERAAMIDGIKRLEKKLTK